MILKFRMLKVFFNKEKFDLQSTYVKSIVYNCTIFFNTDHDEQSAEGKSTERRTLLSITDLGRATVKGIQNSICGVI